MCLSRSARQSFIFFTVLMIMQVLIKKVACQGRRGLGQRTGAIDRLYGPSHFPSARLFHGSPKRGNRASSKERSGGTSSGKGKGKPFPPPPEYLSKKPCPYKLKAELAEHFQWQLEQQLQNSYPYTSTTTTTPRPPPPAPPVPVEPTTTRGTGIEYLQPTQMDPFLMSLQNQALFIDTNGLLQQQPQPTTAFYQTEKDILSKYSSPGGSIGLLRQPQQQLLQLHPSTTNVVQYQPQQPDTLQTLDQILSGGAYGNQLILERAQPPQMAFQRQVFPQQQQQSQQLFLINGNSLESRLAQLAQPSAGGGAFLLPNGQIITSPLVQQQQQQQQQQQGPGQASIVLLDSSQQVPQELHEYLDEYGSPQLVSAPKLSLLADVARGARTRGKATPATILLSAPPTLYSDSQSDAEEQDLMLSLAREKALKRRRRLQLQQQHQQQLGSSYASSSSAEGKRYVIINKEDLKQLKKKSALRKLGKQPRVEEHSLSSSSLSDDLTNRPPPPEVVHIKYHPVEGQGNLLTKPDDENVAAPQQVYTPVPTDAATVVGTDLMSHRVEDGERSSSGGNTHHKTLTFDSYVAGEEANSEEDAYEYLGEQEDV